MLQRTNLITRLRQALDTPGYVAGYASEQLRALAAEISSVYKCDAIAHLSHHQI